MEEEVKKGPKKLTASLNDTLSEKGKGESVKEAEEQIQGKTGRRERELYKSIQRLNNFA